MYKGKLSIWSSVIGGCLIICFIFNCLIPWLGGMFETNSGTIYAESTYDASIITSINNKTFCGVTWSVTKDNPDIFISDKSTPKEGYTIYENYIYTPLVLYVRNAVRNNDSGFISLNPSSDSPAYQIDLYKVLKGMLEDKTWKDIGVSTKVIKDKITLVIPDSRNPYYDSVVDLFYLTLNNGKTPTAMERAELKDEVDDILSKCETVIDISQGLIEEYDSHSTNYKVFIGPEYLYPRGGRELSRENTDAFIPVYFLNTEIISLNLYQRVYNNEKDTTLNTFVSNIAKNSGFFKVTGYRVINSYISLREISKSYADVVPGLE